VGEVAADLCVAASELVVATCFAMEAHHPRIPTTSLQEWKGLETTALAPFGVRCLRGLDVEVKAAQPRPVTALSKLRDGPRELRLVRAVASWAIVLPLASAGKETPLATGVGHAARFTGHQSTVRPDPHQGAGTLGFLDLEVTPNIGPSTDDGTSGGGALFLGDRDLRVRFSIWRRTAGINKVRSSTANLRSVWWEFRFWVFIREWQHHPSLLQFPISND